MNAVRIFLHDSGTKAKKKHVSNSIVGKKGEDPSKSKKDGGNEVLNKEDDVKNITEIYLSGGCNHCVPSFAPLAVEKAVHTRSNTSNMEKKQRFLSEVAEISLF